MESLAFSPGGRPRKLSSVAVKVGKSRIAVKMHSPASIEREQAKSIWISPQLESVAHSGECIPLTIHPLGH